MALKRVRRPSFLRLATQRFRKHSAASKTIARIMLRSYRDGSHSGVGGLFVRQAEGRAGGESAAILLLAIYRLQ